MTKIIFLLLFLFVRQLHSSEISFVPMQNGNLYGTIDEVINTIIPEAIVEKVTIYPQKHNNSEERIKRRGILIRREGAKANIVMCHGFMCNKFDIGFIRGLFGPEYNFLVYDFRAHGEDIEGQTCTFGRDEALDVFAAAQFMKHHEKIKDIPLIAYGFSMGAASSIEAQAQHPNLFKAMILDCPFDSAENMLRRGIGTMTFSLFGYQFYVPGRQLLYKCALHPYVQTIVKPLLKVAANMDSRQINTLICPVYPRESIKKVTVPCLFICCKNDEKVTIDAIKSIYDGAAGYKRLWLTDGRCHCDSFFYNPEGYSKQLCKFLKTVLNDATLQQKNFAKIIEDQIPLDAGGKIL